MRNTEGNNFIHKISAIEIWATLNLQTESYMESWHMKHRNLYLITFNIKCYLFLIYLFLILNIISFFFFCLPLNFLVKLRLFIFGVYFWGFCFSGGSFLRVPYVLKLLFQSSWYFPLFVCFNASIYVDRYLSNSFSHVEKVCGLLVFLSALSTAFKLKTTSLSKYQILFYILFHYGLHLHLN